MKAGKRLAIAIAAAVFAAGHVPALAQNATEATEAPATEAIGPRELQGFSLPGTVTRPAEQPPASRNAPPAARQPSNSRPTSSAAETSTAAPPPARREAPAASAPRTAAAAPVATAEAPRAQSPSLPSVTVPLPTPSDSLTATPTAAAAGTGAGEPDAATVGLAVDDGLPVWPWLLAAMALGVGAAFLFFRRNSRPAYAGGPQVDAFVAPEPAPQPRAPAPAPSPAPEPAKPVGIVSTRLRPWIDLSFEPLRCIVEEERVVFEFEIGLFNSGSAPALDVLIEAIMFNASPTQDQEIGAFFANPVGRGERIPVLPPLKRVSLRPQLAVPRAKLRVLEAGGRRVFVPLLAFNALYSWGRNGGQTSAAYLLGRDTKGEKMGPFRLDLGPRVFRTLRSTPLPTAVRK